VNTIDRTEASRHDEVQEAPPKAADIDNDVAETDPGGAASVEHTDEPTESSGAPTIRRSFRSRWSVARQVLWAEITVVITLSALVGWLGYQAYEAHQANARIAQFVQVGRQGALNLTTIDWEHADADVERILASATGTFYDDFAQRSKPFIEVVKQTKSKTVGTITEAGLESASSDQAQVLVAVNVKTSLNGSPEQAPRSWRMRIAVQTQGDQMKVSNVEFVP
jgi:Mce-associated membrane protein